MPIFKIFSDDRTFDEGIEWDKRGGVTEIALADFSWHKVAIQTYDDSSSTAHSR